MNIQNKYNLIQIHAEKKTYLKRTSHCDYLCNYSQSLNKKKINLRCTYT